MRIFVTYANGFLWREAEPIHSTHKGTGALMAWVAYVLRLTCSSGIGGSAMDGNILLRTISMGEPQQVHSR